MGGQLGDCCAFDQMRSHTAGFVKPINDKADGNVGEQGVERADFGVNRNFQSSSLSFLTWHWEVKLLSRSEQQRTGLCTAQFSLSHHRSYLWLKYAPVRTFNSSLSGYFR